jgi:hypothetical protein
MRVLFISTVQSLMYTLFVLVLVRFPKIKTKDKGARGVVLAEIVPLS